MKLPSPSAMVDHWWGILHQLMMSAALWTLFTLTHKLPAGGAGQAGAVWLFLPRIVMPWHRPASSGTVSSYSPDHQNSQCWGEERHLSIYSGEQVALSNHFLFSGQDTSPWASGRKPILVSQIEWCPSGLGPSEVHATMPGSLPGRHTT